VKPHELQAPPGARRRRKRVGRGTGSGRGKTAGRGTKGTKARSSVPAAFEGGQMPLVRRVPKLKGFKPPARTVYGAVNLDDLSRVEGDDIGPEDMRAAGLVRKRDRVIKVLGEGDLDRAVRVRAHAFSAAARTKIEDTGGSVEVLDAPVGKAAK
jgi:large subunit ribosomal protein L15